MKHRKPEGRLSSDANFTSLRTTLGGPTSRFGGWRGDPRISRQTLANCDALFGVGFDVPGQSVRAEWNRVEVKLNFGFFIRQMTRSRILANCRFRFWVHALKRAGKLRIRLLNRQSLTIGTRFLRIGHSSRADLSVTRNAFWYVTELSSVRLNRIGRVVRSRVAYTFPVNIARTPPPPYGVCYYNRYVCFAINRWQKALKETRVCCFV